MSAASVIDLSMQSKVLKALENPEYVWRTVSGLEKETKLPRAEILATLEDLPEDALVRSLGRNGVRVYSTREHYRKTQSFVGRLISVLSGQVK